jgi:hypothetical protein
VTLNISQVVMNEPLLQEGGMVGHLYHLHDNPDLTFAEIKDLLSSAAEGKLERVSEKLDGLNLVFSWDVQSDELRTARNSGDIKSGERNTCPGSNAVERGRKARLCGR